MGCKIQLFRHLTTFISTYSDVGSDIINSLDFLGYNASTEISKTMWESVSSVMGHEDNLDVDVYNGTDSTSIEEYKNEYEIHEIWGIMGFSVIFLPGIIMAPSFLLRNIVDSNSIGQVILIVLMAIFFPITLLLTTFGSMIPCFYSEELLEFTNFFVGMEAFFESFTQLTLQGFTILYGYQTTSIQLITMTVSFLLLSRTSILFDISMGGKELTFKETIFHTIKIIPCYATTIIF